MPEADLLGTGKLSFDGAAFDFAGSKIPGKEPSSPTLITWTPCAKAASGAQRFKAIVAARAATRAAPLLLLLCFAWAFVYDRVCILFDQILKAVTDLSGKSTKGSKYGREPGWRLTLLDFVSNLIAFFSFFGILFGLLLRHTR